MQNCGGNWNFSGKAKCINFLLEVGHSQILDFLLTTQGNIILRDSTVFKLD